MNKQSKLKGESMKKSTKKLPYVIIRSAQAGVFAGYLKTIDDSTVQLTRSRRIWYWKGAASLSEMAVSGVACPDECKFPAEVENHTILSVCEILYATEKARKSIEAVKIWSMK